MRMAPDHSEPWRMADQRRKGSPRPARGSPARRTHAPKCVEKHLWWVTQEVTGTVGDGAIFCVKTCSRVGFVCCFWFVRAHSQNVFRRVPSLSLK